MTESEPLYQWHSLYATVLYASRNEAGPDWSIPHRINPFAALWYMLDGHIYIDVNGIRVAAGPGDILLLPPHTPFQAFYQGTYRFNSNLYIRFRLLDSNGIDWFDRFTAPVKLREDSRFLYHEAVSQLCGMYDAPAPFQQMRMDGALQQLLGELLAAASVVPRRSEGRKGLRNIAAVQELIAWMYEHMSENITLGQLAQRLHVSPDYLIDAFKDVVGTTPLKFLQNIRLQRAKQLLLQSGLTVQEISARVGWHDSFYFSRLFKKAEGIPPTTYRKMMLSY